VRAPAGTEGGDPLTTTSNGAIETLQFVAVHQSDPLASPLLDELTVEYSSRYGASDEEEYNDLRAYPAAEFDPPGGVLIVAVSNGVPVAGGAFRRYDASTAELKRMWTAAGHRKRGYGKLVVAELERIALQRGYTRVYLTTGWRQPEAVALYLSTGYTPLYDVSLPADAVGVHPFEKLLDAGASS
jgi:GNAT superfamily N-acetyltransferase